MAQAEEGAVTEDVLGELAERTEMDIGELASLARQLNMIADDPSQDGSDPQED